MKKDSSDVDRIKKVAWQSMEQMLNDEMPIQKKKERKYGIWFMYSVAASLILIFTATVVSYSLMKDTQNARSIAFIRADKVQSISQDKYGYFFSPSESNEQIEQSYNIQVENQVTRQQSSLVERVNKTNQSKFEDQSRRDILGGNKKQVQENLNKKSIDIQTKQFEQKNRFQQDQEVIKNEVVRSEKQLEPSSEQEGGFNSLLKNKMTTNQVNKPITIISTADMRKTLVNGRVDLGLKTNGSIGFVSKDLNQYGLRLGLEFSKPVSSSLSVNTGVRYSTYKQNYNSTYKLDKEMDYIQYDIISDLSNRKVNRRFLEFPLYANYALTDAIKLKAGSLLTYNKNNSSNASHSALSIANSNDLSDFAKLQAGKLMQDKHGYLGEAVVGATIELDKISLDVEGNYGLISNQTIDNRSVLGFRLNYKFGQ